LGHPRNFCHTYAFSIFIWNCFKLIYKWNKYDFVALGYIFVIFITQLAWAISQSPRTREFPTSARKKFGSWRFISQSLILIRLWEVKKFQAQQLVLSGARMRISGSKLKLSKNDLYFQYLHLSDHHLTKFRTKIRTLVQICIFNLHFSNINYNLNFQFIQEITKIPLN